MLEEEVLDFDFDFKEEGVMIMAPNLKEKLNLVFKDFFLLNSLLLVVRIIPAFLVFWSFNGFLY